MYEFHYKYIKTKYYNHAQLLFTDTDSLVYENETNDVYEERICLNLVTKLIVKMKDEVKRKIINDFLGLKSKMHSLVIVNNAEIKKQDELIKMFLKR